MFTNLPETSEFDSHPNVLRVTECDPGITVVIDADYEAFMDFLDSSNVIAYTSGLSGRSRSRDVMLRHPDVTGPANIYPAERTETVYTFDDFFVPAGDDPETQIDDNRPDRVGVTVSPFGGREQLGQRTGRDYLREDCLRIWWLIYAATYSTNPPALPSP